MLIHGTSASLHTWEGWAKALSAQHRVISFDLPGFGLTGPNASGDYRGDTYARFVLDLMDQLKVQRFAIAGNSLGGEVAWRTALMAPQRVTKLILVDAAGPDFSSDSVPIGFLVARVPVLNRIFDWVLPRPMVVASVRNVYGDPSRVNEALVDRYYQLALREGNRRALVQRFQQNRRGAGCRAHPRAEAADADPVGRARPAGAAVGGPAVPAGHRRQRAGGLRRPGPCAARRRPGAHAARRCRHSWIGVDILPVKADSSACSTSERNSRRYSTLMTVGRGRQHGPAARRTTTPRRRTGSRRAVRR